MKKGFTLLEILIVIIIIGILATFAIPQYMKASRKAIASEAVTTIGAIRGAIARYYQEYNTVPSTTSNLDIDDPNTVPGARFSYTINAGTDPYHTNIEANGNSGTRADKIKVTYDAQSGKTKIEYNGQEL